VLTFVSKYATAAHLALLTVAPLFLFPFCGEGEIAKVLFWLSLLVASWVVMEPSPIGDEYPHDARRRFAAEVVKDPLFWFSVVLVVFAFVRSVNGGVRLAYDAEAVEWSLRNPAVGVLPGCVDGAGILPFAACVALLVGLQGFRHSIDGGASVAYLVAASIFAGISAIVAVCAFAFGNQSVASLVKCEYLNPTFIGTAYGVHLAGGLVALFCCVERRWVAAEMIVAVGMAASTLGLVFFAPIATILVFGILFLVLLLVSAVLSRHAISSAGWLRCMILLLPTVIVAIVAFMLDSDFAFMSAKREALLSFSILPDGFREVRDALSGISLRAWKDCPWLGTGLGAFPLKMRFVATQADWSVVSPFQCAPCNGFWAFLVERGVIGASFLVVGTAILAWTYIARLVFSRSPRRWRGIHFLAPLTMLALVAVALVDCSFMRADVLLAGGAAMALSSAALPAEGRCGKTDEEVS
jgi:hypothetical protein